MQGKIKFIASYVHYKYKRKLQFLGQFMGCEKNNCPSFSSIMVLYTSIMVQKVHRDKSMEQQKRYINYNNK